MEIRQNKKQCGDVRSLLTAQTCSCKFPLKRVAVKMLPTAAAGSLQLILKIEKKSNPLFFIFYKNAQKRLVLNTFILSTVWIC